MIPKISIAIPYHQSEKSAFYLSRLLKSIDEQSFKDYEIVLTAEGGFARNHNAAIMNAKGEIIQMMQMDDYFCGSQALSNIVWNYENTPEISWMMSAYFHDFDGKIGNIHTPEWTDDIYTGNNRLGSVSALSFKKDKTLLFEEPLTWVVDCDLYYRLYLKYGLPHINKIPDIVVDSRTDRLSHTIPNDIKNKEVEYLIKKYA